MIKSKVFQIADKVFGHVLVDIGIGGSPVNDIDTIAILDKIYPKQIRKFIDKASKATGRKVSVRPVTPMMLDSDYVDSKVATMLYKGVVWSSGKDRSISFSKLQEITKPLMAQNVSELIRCAVSGKISEEKAINLLTQLLTVCQ